MLFTLLLALALQKPASQTLTVNWPDGSPRVVREVISNGAGGWTDDGAYTSFHENGARAEAGRHAKGLRVGLWESFHPNGKPASKGRYLKGRMDGKWSFWRDDGAENLADSGTYQPVLETDEQGRVVCEGQTRDDQAHGLWSSYGTDGTLQQRGTFRNGRKHGEWAWFGVDSRPVSLFGSGVWDSGVRISDLPPERSSEWAAQVRSSAPSAREAKPALPAWFTSDPLDEERRDSLREVDAHHATASLELAHALLAADLDAPAERAAAERWCRFLAHAANHHHFGWPSESTRGAPADFADVVAAWSGLLASRAGDWRFWRLELRNRCYAQVDQDHGQACPLLQPGQLRGTDFQALRRDGPQQWYALRTSDAKTRTRLCGGAKEAAALDAALNWLVEHQDPQGHWAPDGFQACCRHSEVCGGIGESPNRVGVTSLAVLALLGDGSTLSRGAHRDAVRRGVLALVNEQDAATGQLAQATWTTFMYDHAFATLALSEVLVFDDDPNLRAAVEAAVAFLVARQLGGPRAGGGWSYGVRGMEAHVDSSLCSCILLALSAARDAGVAIEPRVFKEALRFLDELTDPVTGRTGYDNIGSFSARVTRINEHFPLDANEPLTALALAARIAAGETAKAQPLFAKGASLMQHKLPRWETGKLSVDFYYWTFGAFAMHGLVDAREAAAWIRAVRAALLAGQEQAPGVRGSWDPQFDPWGYTGGRVYMTAMGALALEAPLRMDPARYSSKK